jgi:transposase
MVTVRRRVFPEAFKREAVERVATSDLSVAAVAAELEIHETILRRWMNQFPATSGAIGAKVPPLPAVALAATPELMLEIAELRSENERLRQEREVLKKALAIVFAELK